MPKLLTYQMENLKPTFEKVYSATESRDLGGLFEAFAVLAAAVTDTVVGKPAGDPAGPLAPSYPPAMTGAQLMENIRAGYLEEGIRGVVPGGKAISDHLLQTRMKRLPSAFAMGDRYGVPRDTMEFIFLAGRVTDGKDVPDPADPNPATPGFISPWEGLENYRGMTADMLVANYWREKNAGNASGGAPVGSR